MAFDDDNDPEFEIPETQEERLKRECKAELCHDLRKMMLDDDGLPLTLRILTQFLGVMEQHYANPPKRFLKAKGKEVSSEEIANLLEVLKREAANLEAPQGGSIIPVDKRQDSAG